MSQELRDCVDVQDLRVTTIHDNDFVEQQKKKLNPLKLRKNTKLQNVSHHVAEVGLMKEFLSRNQGVIAEESSEMDVIYDPNDLAKAAKKWGKLTKAAAIGNIVYCFVASSLFLFFSFFFTGAAIGGGVGVCIPIPGLFFLISFAGSLAGRWIAGKFITDDGVELEDVVPILGVRGDNDDESLFEIVQDFDEDAPPLEATWNKYKKKYFKKNTSEDLQDGEFVVKENEQEKGVETQQAPARSESWFVRTFWGTETPHPAQNEEEEKEEEMNDVPEPEELPIDEEIVFTDVVRAEPPSHPPREMPEKEVEEKVEQEPAKDLLSFVEEGKNDDVKKERTLMEFEEEEQLWTKGDLEEEKKEEPLVDLGEVEAKKEGTLIDLGD